MNIDTTTIDMKRLALLPAYVKPPTYRIDSHMGNGCAGDPPGYPTYFTQSVYTGSGNSPRPRSPCLVLFGHVVDDGRTAYEDVKATLHKLWLPLPLQHPRTQAWIRDRFSYLRHCYHVPGREHLPFHDKARSLIWPGGCLGETPFGTLQDLEFETKQAVANRCYEKWTRDAKEAFIKQILEGNIRIKAECEAVAVPDNAVATILVRRFYPDFVPGPELFEEGLQSPGTWWERLPRQPSPEECPGESWHKHPCNTTWCQVCGWREPEKKKGAEDAQV